MFLVARRGGTHDVIGDLRVLGLLLALGSGYVLDDGAAVTLQASPYSLARRLWLRIGCAAAVVVPLWTALLARFLPSAPAGDRWALGLGLTIELAAALTVIWAVAAWGRRHGVRAPRHHHHSRAPGVAVAGGVDLTGADAGRAWSTMDTGSPAMVGASWSAPPPCSRPPRATRRAGSCVGTIQDFRAPKGDA